ncbi:hypothetical protein RI367_008131 [Sorochytrium milnesiophthora]
MQLLSLLLAVLVLLPLVSANLYNFGRLWQQYEQRQELAALGIDAAGSATEQLWFKQKLDHFDFREDRTFEQRYYVNDTFYRRGGPVFLYVGGEAPLTNASVRTGFQTQLAQKHRALLLSLEHRYYGPSKPQNASFNWLNSEQALQDLAYFAQTVAVKGHSNAELRQGKWITIGGSYPANLAAWMRLKYPHLIYGAYSSSGPVLAKEEFVEYDEAVAGALPGHCLAAVQRATAELEMAALNQTDKLGGYKRQLNASELTDNIGFLYGIADMISFLVQYSPKDGNRSLTDVLCKDTFDRADGVTEADQLLGFLALFIQKTGLSLQSFDLDTAMRQDPSMRSWMWQSCIEFGYFQSASPRYGHSVRSKLVSLQWHRELCARHYGLHHPPDVSGTNARYGGLDIHNQAHRIIFANGSRDPWRTLSVVERHGHSEDEPDSDYDDEDSVDATRKHRNRRRPHRRLHDVIMIKGASHCNELRPPRDNDLASVKEARRQIDRIFTSWLKERRPLRFSVQQV